MITRVKIEGYKSIKDLDIELDSINILLGGNGVGKSNFISIFSLVKSLYQKNLQNYVQSKGGADTFLHFGKKVTDRIVLDFFFRSGEGHENQFIVKLQEAQDTLMLEQLSTKFKTGFGWSEQIHESNRLESNFRNSRQRQAYYVNDRLKEFQVYHFHDTGDKSPMKGKSNIEDSWLLKSDGSNLAAFLYYLKLEFPKHFVRIEKLVQSIAPFFDRFELNPSRLNSELIQLEWKEKGHPESYFNAYHLSDGTLRFICLATLLMQPNPSKTIIIDEPELGLHPVAINKLAALIKKVSKTTQIIISTQSINLIDNFDPENIIVADRRKDETGFQRLDPQELAVWLKDYSLGDLWGMNRLGAQPYKI